MSITVVIGSQWGDEGKGKIIDVLSSMADFVVRFHGGNNAGHTVVNQYGKFPLHLIPCGIFAKKVKVCITNGVVLDLEVLVAEIELLKKAGFTLEGRLFISPRCHMILPYHKILDKLYEEAKGKAKTGTTGRGIG
ncbi:adenylosuccinate synthetase, partial [Patescibacteria group bacterium]|nr:adenylosuccinate synthetase [Patescibacteria group bacterium]